MSSKDKNESYLHTLMNTSIRQMEQISRSCCRQHNGPVDGKLRGKGSTGKRRTWRDDPKPARDRSQGLPVFDCTPIPRHKTAPRKPGMRVEGNLLPTVDPPLGPHQHSPPADPDSSSQLQLPDKAKCPPPPLQESHVSSSSDFDPKPPSQVKGEARQLLE